LLIKYSNVFNLKGEIMGCNTTKERAKEVLDCVAEYGEEKASKILNIKIDTIRRYLDRWKDDLKEDFEDKQLTKKLNETFTKKELQALIASKNNSIKYTKTIRRDFDGDVITFAHITDTHIGSIYFSPIDFEAMINECEREKVQFICHSGDVTEGLSHRPDHYYQCTHIGYEAQLQYAVKLFSLTDIPVYMIDGNHDRWFIKSAGAKIVKNICDKLKHCIFLGHDNGKVITNGVTIELFHGEDFSSYATSYRIQKLIEAMEGGSKPNVLLAGHTHKQGYFFERNIHALTGGALSYQSAWMKSKRMACHTGFWIIKMCVKEKEIKWLSPRWYPFYKRIDNPVKVDYNK